MVNIVEYRHRYTILFHNMAMALNNSSILAYIMLLMTCVFECTTMRVEMHNLSCFLIKTWYFAIVVTRNALIHLSQKS